MTYITVIAFGLSIGMFARSFWTQYQIDALEKRVAELERRDAGRRVTVAGAMVNEEMGAR